MKVSRDGRPGEDLRAVSGTGVVGGDGAGGMVVLQAMTEVARSARKSGASASFPGRMANVYLQTSSRETSVRMNSSKAGLWTPQVLRDAGWTLSSKTGDMTSNAGVPTGYRDVA